MQSVDSFNRLKTREPRCQLIQLGCFYVVSINLGNRQVSSSPHQDVNSAVEEFEFKYAMVNFDNLSLAS